jgi:uncharacterized Tic20 family protein
MDETTPATPSVTSPAEIAPANKDENTLGIVCHLLALAAFVVPFGGILGPLILWLVKRADSPYLDAVGKEAVNFNISWTIYILVAALSMFVLIGFLLLPLVGLVWLIFVIMAAIKASEGKFHRYPLTIRLIS